MIVFPAPANSFFDPNSGFHPARITVRTGRVTLTFTAAAIADIPTLRDLAHRIWHACYPALISVAQIDYMLARFFDEAALRRDLEGGVIWELAWLEAQPVAFLACVTEAATQRLKLSKLYLLPEFHGQGLGQQLLARVTAIANRTQARAIYLTVNKGNVQAIRAYERAGYRKTDSLIADIGGGFVMDDYIMTLVLPSPAVIPSP